ncbi:hypothetical protein RRF57_007720 [Xylaria bambusicola]|uniref:Uncharacterized protein n=1 Tax=Xylaria bambusicola TaxID=326684 RepID=A0AAN7UU58_9PEZI
MSNGIDSEVDRCRKCLQIARQKRDVQGGGSLVIISKQKPCNSNASRRARTCQLQFQVHDAVAYMIHLSHFVALAPALFPLTQPFGRGSRRLETALQWRFMQDTCKPAPPMLRTKEPGQGAIMIGLLHGKAI